MSFPDVELAAGGILNVAGAIVASNNILIEDNSSLVLGDSVSGSSGSLTSPLVQVLGSLSGVGVVSGDIEVNNGGLLSPGFSPGVISADNLTLNTGSITEMELSGVTAAGQDFDQIIIENQLTINDGATLDLVSLDGFELAAGDVARIFVTSPGALTGTFSDVASEFSGDVALNLSNGTVIGLGVDGLAALNSAVSQSSNQTAMLDSFRVASHDGVAQFRGGYLIERLGVAGENASARDQIFAQMSPVTYGALLDQAQLSIFQTRIDLPRNASEAESGVAVGYGYDVNESDADDRLDNYELKRQVESVQYDRAFDWGVVSVGVASEQRDVRAKYLSADTDGLSFNAAATFVLNEDFSVSVDANWIDHDVDSRRTTSNGVALADGIGAEGFSGGITLSFDKELADNQIFASVAVVDYDIDVDAFDERNQTSVLDSLQVQRQSANATAFQADAIVLRQLTDTLRLGGALKFTDFSGDVRDSVTANVTTEDVSFSVLNKGIGSQLIELGVTADFTPTERWKVKFDAGFQGESSLDGTRARVQVRYSL